MTINDLFPKESFNGSLKNKSFAGKGLSKICADSDFVFYGAGQTGEFLYEQLGKINIHPKAFADDTLSKQGKYIGSKEIYSLSKLENIFGKDVVLVVTIFHPAVSFLQVKKKLNSFGFENVLSFLDIFLLFPDILLPFYHFDNPAALITQKENYVKAFELFRLFPRRLDFNTGYFFMYLY
jgi:hypothetical protein